MKKPLSREESDRILAYRIHDAADELNNAVKAARLAGLEVSVNSFDGTGVLVAYVARVIPRVVVTYGPRSDDDVVAGAQAPYKLTYPLTDR